MDLQDSNFNRRQFLQSASALGLGLTVSGLWPRALSADDKGQALLKQSSKHSDNVLVVVQLSGGNDGLNTVIPTAQDAYYRLRPNIAIKRSNALKVNDDLSLHSSLAGFQRLLGSGQLAIINGVGYAKPNRSHFRSMDIWHTASDSNRTVTEGWLGRFYGRLKSGRNNPLIGVSIGQGLPLAFKGSKSSGVSFSNPYSLRWVEGASGDHKGAYRKVNHLDKASPKSQSNLGFLRHVTQNATRAADRLIKASQQSRSRRPAVAYPRNGFGNALKLVADLIKAQLPTKVFQVSLGGFDTHANQAGTHTFLLRQLGDGLAAFVADLKKLGHSQRVLTLCFSEFGRRVKENGSRGTDHGTAAPMFCIGDSIKAGVYGSYPKLDQLDKNKDLIFSTDFRSVYSTVLDGWFGVDSTAVLGKKFAAVNFIGAHTKAGSRKKLY
jgi:uncharacterized protein (DUF1501 family)